MSDRSNYKAGINTSHADNTAGDISALDGRNGFKDLADFVRFKKDDFPINTALTTGTGAAYNVTIDYPDALTDNYSILLKIHTNSTSTTPTLAITPTGGSALTATTMKRGDGSALVVGDLKSGKYYLTSYDGTDFLVYSGIPEGGDVTGPGSSTDNAIARYDGTTGKTIQNSGVTLTDGGAINFGQTDLGFFSIGTWTPAISGSTTNPTVGYTLQTGYYMRVGTYVIVVGNMITSSFSGGSGNVNITGLPYTPASSEQSYGACTLNGITYPGSGNTQASCRINTTTYTSLEIVVSGDGTTGSLIGTGDMGGGDHIYVFIAYRT